MIGKLGFLGFFTLGVAMGQTPVAPRATQHTAASVSAKTLVFEVVSIRQNISPASPQSAGPTADGYRMTNLPLMLPLLTAFVPQRGGGMFPPDQIQGLPEWIKKEHYDLDARIAGEDRTDWQNPARQAAILPAMLQAALADRCKLVAHRETKQNSVYFLVVRKTGAKFAETNPTDPAPAGATLPGSGGAVLVRSNNTLDLYGTSMGFFATMLTGMGTGTAGEPIVDKTGLTGKYNIIVKSIISHQGEQPSSGEATDPAGSIFSAVEALGLKLVAGKAPVETLVIDHIERPSPN